MKTIFLLLLLLPFIITAQLTPKYASVAIQISQPNMVVFLNDHGLEIDHAHQIGKNELAVAISHEEVNLLANLNVSYRILVEDLAANYEEINEQLGSRHSISCGLANFDSGEMGHYHSYQDMINHINLMQSNYPGIVQISDIGSSVEGRTIYAVKISDNVATDESDSEGVVYYDALTHAREPMSLETVLFYMWSLLENYNADSELTYLINNREIYFVPIVNPDGYVYNQTTNPNGGGFWRKNRRDNGNNCYGIDLNRNFGHQWSNPAGSSDQPCSDTYHGPSEFSEPETQAVRDFTLLIQPTAAFSNHSSGDVFLCPNGFSDELDQYEHYAEYASEFIPKFYQGYGNWIQMIGYYGAGTTHDYLNSEGVIAYTPEIGHTFWEPPSVICDRITEMYPAMKYMSWIVGAYTRFHDFEKISEAPIWEGNTTDIKIRIKNRGLRFSATNVQVVLSSDFAGLSFLNDTVLIGNIPPRSFADNVDHLFSFNLNNSVQPGQEIPIRVKIYQEGVLSDEEVFHLYVGEENILFEEDGEHGIQQWEIINGPFFWDSTFMDAVGGAHSITDTRYHNTPLSSYSLLHTADPIAIFPEQNFWLEFYAKWSFQPEFDFARVLYSADDGNTWIPLAGAHSTTVLNQPAYTNQSHWVQERINLQDIIFTDSIYIGFEISTNEEGIATDGFYFDNLRVVDYLDPALVAVTTPSDEQNIKVYPNPANQTLFVDFLTGNLNSYDLALFNIQGQIVFEKKQARQHESISLSAIPNGVYWLKLRNKNQLVTRKIVKMR